MHGLHPYIESMESIQGIHISNAHSQSRYPIHILRSQGTICEMHISNRIENMDSIYGCLIWIQYMASPCVFDISIPCMYSLYAFLVCHQHMDSTEAFSIWIEYMDAIHGFNIWIPCMGSMCGSNIWIQYMHSICAFPICIQHMQ